MRRVLLRFEPRETEIAVARTAGRLDVYDKFLFDRVLYSHFFHLKNKYGNTATITIRASAMK